MRQDLKCRSQVQLGEETKDQEGPIDSTVKKSRFGEAKVAGVESSLGVMKAVGAGWASAQILSGGYERCAPVLQSETVRIPYQGFLFGPSPPLTQPWAPRHHANLTPSLPRPAENKRHFSRGMVQGKKNPVSQQQAYNRAS